MSLSPQAVALLEQIHAITGKFELVFAGDAKPWKPMSENTVNAALTWWSRFLEANREDHLTPHEFAKQTGENVTRLRSAKRTE